LLCLSNGRLRLSHIGKANLARHGADIHWHCTPDAILTRGAAYLEVMHCFFSRLFYKITVSQLEYAYCCLSAGITAAAASSD
jgi:hypothetical protein